MSVAVTAAYEAYSTVGAALKKVRAIAVSTASQNQDIAGGAATEITAAVSAGRMLRLRADGGDVYYGFYYDASLSIDQTITAQGNSAQCDVIPAGQFVDVRPPYDFTGGNQKGIWSFLYYKGSVACTLRISVCSEEVSNKS